MTIPSLAMIPSGYKDGKVYSVLPANGGGDFDFTRGSNATRVNKDGLIETATGDTPRLDYSGSSCPSLLLEPQRTNLATYSEDFSDSSWVKANVDVTHNAGIAPDGTVSLSSIDSNSSVNSEHRFRLAPSLSVSTTYNASVFVKSKDSGVYLYFRDLTNNSTSFYDVENNTVLATGVGQTVNSTSFGDFFRLDFTFTTPLSITNNFVDFGITSVSSGVTSVITAGQGMYFWGVQLEEGSYPTSYIPTQGSAVTRLADSCSQTVPDGVIGQTEGVAYVEIDWKGNDEESVFGVLHDGTVDNRMDFGYSETFHSFYFNIRANGSSQGLMQYANPIIGKYKIAIYYKNNDFAFWINGVKEVVDTNGTVPITTKYNVGNYIGGGKEYPIMSSKLYSTALTDEELKELTS